MKTKPKSIHRPGFIFYCTLVSAFKERICIQEGIDMAEFIAHYRSPDGSSQRAKGMFEFTSSSRIGSKANMHDVRVHMLELFGNEALAWTIDSIERKSTGGKADHADGQLELDFRDPATHPERKRRRSVRRGIVS